MESDLTRYQRERPASVGAGRHSDAAGSGWPLKGARLWVAPSLVIAWCLAIRLVSLDTIPPNVSASEANSLRDVVHVLAGRGGPGLFGLDWSGSPAFGIYLTAAFVSAFGPSIVAMRLASVVVSTLTLVPLYFLARERLSATASLMVCFLTSISLLYLNASRNSWQDTSVSLFSLTAALCLIHAVKGHGPLHGRLCFVLAGASAALAAYSDISGITAIVSLLAFLPFALFEQRASARRVLVGYLLILVTAIVVTAPQATAIATNWEAFSHSASATAISAAAQPSPGSRSSVEAAKSQLGRIVTGFVLLDGHAIDDTRYSPVGRPILDPVSGSLFVIGLAVALYRLRRHALWLCLFVVPLGAMLARSTWLPGAALAVPLVPVMCLFAGRGFDAIGARGGAWMRLVQLVVIVSIPWVAYDNLAGYVRWSATPEVAAARAPAVEVAEFGTWWRLQADAAARGEPGFSAEDWQQLRGSYADQFQRSTADARRQPDATHPDSSVASPVESQPAPRLLTPDASFQADLFAQPRGIAFAPDGGMYVADAAAHEVVRLDSQGKVRYRLGGEGAGDGQFLEPWDVAVDFTGRVYVLDSLQEGIQRFSPNGEFEARLLAKEGLYRPRGIAFGDDGIIYVADTGRNRVLKADRTGRLVAAIGETEGGVKLDQPTDIAVDTTGAIWIVEPAAKRLQRFDAAGKRVGIWGYPAADTLNAPHLTLAGEWLLGTDPAHHRLVAFNLVTARSVTWQPNAEDDIQLVQPFAVAANPDGTVAISDSQTGSVRRFRLGSAD